MITTIVFILASTRSAIDLLSFYSGYQASTAIAVVTTQLFFTCYPAIRSSSLKVDSLGLEPKFLIANETWYHFTKGPIRWVDLSRPHPSLPNVFGKYMLCCCTSGNWTRPHSVWMSRAPYTKVHTGIPGIISLPLQGRIFRTFLELFLNVRARFFPVLWAFSLMKGMPFSLPALYS